MSESITERAENIVNGGDSTTYPGITSAKYVRHTMARLLAELTRLQQSNAALVEAQQWHSIKTAPRTGGEFLGMRSDGQRHVVFWEVEGFRIAPDGPRLNDLTRWCAIPPNLALANA